jgi:ribonuclease D
MTALIADTETLAAFCARLRAADQFVTVDTEFMRDRTYWPRLCLVQVGGEAEAAAVDPLSPGIDLGPLLDLMADPAVLKVMHAARQDLEIFHLLGRIPSPFFDTQVAAMVCGFGEEVAYDTLVAKLARAQIDKSSRFTDWARRPLTPAQVTYALGDVTHLRTVYRELKADIDRRGRAPWVEEELRDLTDPNNFEPPAEDAWKRLKIRTRDRQFLAIVQDLATWRELEARRRDLPRQRIIRDDLLMEVAASKPRSVEELRSLERVNVDRESASGIVASIARALAIPRDKLPKLPETPQLPRGTGPVVDLLRVLLKQRCETADVAQKLVANGGDLEAIALDDKAAVPALQGWRREIFGDAALALKRGELALAVGGQGVTVLARDGGQGWRPASPV